MRILKNRHTNRFHLILKENPNKILLSEECFSVDDLFKTLKDGDSMNKKEIESNYIELFIEKKETLTKKIIKSILEKWSKLKKILK